ncbi:MAG: 7-dehydrocholesterol reductase [Simkaniaceae bacterium]|nr:7-dehydrocholesterol reductase [Simkaniaceae bacterium]
MYRFLRKTIGPLLLIVLCPVLAITVWYTSAIGHGSFKELFQTFSQNGIVATYWHMIKPVFFGTPTAWKIIGTFAAFQLLLMRIIPGKTTFGPRTPKGNIPVYKDNGFAAFIVTLVTFYVSTQHLHLFSATIVYDHLGEIIGAMSFFSIILCLALYIKGRFFPSSSDHGATGNFIFDFYWGTELYPRIFGFDVKVFTNCRFGMMSWPIIILSCAAKQTELYGLSTSMIVSVALQLIYIGKFFLWESGYLCSMDIMHDRGGFYICWGCLVWVPAFYTSPAQYLVHNPHMLSTWLAASIFAIGAAGIMVNYFADRQRQVFRRKAGACKIWGNDPKITKAYYSTDEGKTYESLLLASGWWGISRHFHYLPEIVGALFWSLPALFGHFMPYFYVVFLGILLVDRAFRDEQRCQEKYGDYWDAHCEKVRYKLIPYLF